MIRIAGVIPAMATPLSNEGRSVHLGMLDRLCDFLIERQVTGLFVLGSTGEGALLSSDERKEVGTRVLEHVNGRVPIIINCGDVTTRGSIDLALHARAAGAQAISVVFPYYYPISRSDAVNHFVTVAKAVPDMAVFVYYFGRSLLPDETLQVRSEAPNVIGMKDGMGDYALIQGHARVMGDSFTILEGSERLAYAALTMGAAGLISGVATAFPEPFVRIYDLLLRGQYAEARREQDLICKLADVIYDRNPWGRIKKALLLRGIDVGRPRGPIGECGDEETEQIRRSLGALGLV